VGVHISDVNRWYEERVYQRGVAEYYDQSDFFNFGYWLEDTASQREACESLMDKLLTFIPEKKGKILDVACGRGATTRHLLRYYRPSDVIGVDVSQQQLETGKLNASGCRFMVMDATDLAFEDGFFNSVICVEAAFHFGTREQFLREACRVLQPGGHLVLSDILLAKWAEEVRHIRTVKNYLPDLKAYQEVYSRAGFQDVQVVDATQECWRGFYKHWLHWQWQVTLLSRRDVRAFALFLPQLVAGICAMRYYLLVSARKA
jgi:ubiquinone/menaquinone biosynthesis C-methylase UbiE